MVQSLKIMPSVPLQLGWISYWNMMPLRQELERLTGHEIEFHKGTPAQVNKWLSDGKVSLAPSSSICLVRNSHNEIALPLGIAANGPVASVYIGLHHEDAHMVEIVRGRQALLRDIVRQGQARYENDARKLAAYVFKMAAALPACDVDPPPLVVTPASATGANLARILYRLWFGESAYELRAADNGSAAANTALLLRRPMELVIGDEALVRRPQYRAVIDLGESWKDLTDLPFVFGIWQSSRKPLNPYWRQKILEAAELAQARMRVEPCHYLPDMPVTDANGKTVDLCAYWKLIQYRLGPQHFRGLALFLALSRLLSPGLVDDIAAINITRWETLGATGPLRS